MNSTVPKTRTIHHADALTWLENNPDLSGCSIVTSLPDFSEFPNFTLEEWKDWFIKAASLCLSRCPKDGVTIFYQTDLKKDGVWIDKGFLCQKAAELTHDHLLWHKIVCRVPAGNITFGKPAYSHLLCFSKNLKAEVSKSTADVLIHAGKTTWTRGMGTKACEEACRTILSQTPSHTVVDPFCGHGTVLAVANQVGLNAIGVELSRKRAQIARNLQVNQI
jgi:hypothetical protein